MNANAGAVKVGADEGDARTVLGSIDTVKMTASQTRGLFGLIAWKEAKRGGPPLHVHTREDEAYYILSGDVTFFIGDEVIQAPTGTFLYAPRGVAHSWSVESEEATGLQLMFPGGFESFFLETFPPASSKRPEGADLAQIVEAAARFGVTILGPQPAHEASLTES